MNGLDLREPRLPALRRLWRAGIILGVFALIHGAFVAGAALLEEPSPPPGAEILRQYFQSETASVASACLAGIRTLDDWTSVRPQRRQELLEMLGLDPLPTRG